MRRHQYDLLAAEHGTYFDWSREGEPRPRINLVTLTGKHRLKPGYLIGNSHGILSVVVADQILAFNYSRFEMASETGEPVIEPSKDMTGRSIEVGALVCYSIGAGANSHACELGKVTRIHPSGAIATKPLIRNGDKIEAGNYYARERKMVTPSRSLLLPVDLTMITMWLLSDFNNFKAEDM